MLTDFILPTTFNRPRPTGWMPNHKVKRIDRLPVQEVLDSNPGRVKLMIYKMYTHHDIARCSPFNRIGQGLVGSVADNVTQWDIGDHDAGCSLDLPYTGSCVFQWSSSLKLHSHKLSSILISPGARRSSGGRAPTCNCLDHRIDPAQPLQLQFGLFMQNEMLNKCSRG